MDCFVSAQGFQESTCILRRAQKILRFVPCGRLLTIDFHRVFGVRGIVFQLLDVARLLPQLAFDSGLAVLPSTLHCDCQPSCRIEP
ncbi:hypothetical protein [Mycobacterium avium]|uniref:hypothetical protein n=1 Tax=Mycobacterium avium TaxID=1764 RepID=UPI00037138E9|nr:hypothetical protein [Mycobacterium avium]ETB02266.1 hypothetical protein O978_16265 [Mycobacterium avium subsp. paratuberculosis 10-5864]ETB10362.1 hypothetical protein O980_15915 [Mycobacterium avium subsp. paratuberculosis 08-8281]ETB28339.1 hypothetical protein O977_20410 [Mycobacterium avium subsp. paratuberculosis 10-5975]ETB37378.1 hypothetical protein O975_17425 [Mycobacterium avium subsp. paratuberculosis 11-1786]ETB49321.1 hypothetical protein O976_16810 [Mycobacterium avium subsp